MQFIVANIKGIKFWRLNSLRAFELKSSFLHIVHHVNLQKVTSSTVIINLLAPVFHNIAPLTSKLAPGITKTKSDELARQPASRAALPARLCFPLSLGI